jgi:hypothetical protein
MPPTRTLRLESWAVMRARLLRETECFLAEGLRHPERNVIIPAIPVGSGTFPRGYAQLFWAQVLGAS